MRARARAGALAAALPVAGGDEVEGIAGALLELVDERTEVEILAALAGEWCRVSDRTRERVAQAVGAWEGMGERGGWGEVAGVLAVDPLDSRREALARIAGEVADVEVAERLVGLLGDGCETVRAAAEASLVGLAGRDGEGWARAADVAVGGAAAGYAERRSLAVVVALIRLAARPGGVAAGGRVAGVLADERDPVHGAVRQYIRRSSGGVSAAEAWRLLRVGAWAPACADRLARGGAGDAAAWGGVLGLVHLLEHPVRRKEVARLAQREGGEGLADELIELAGGHGLEAARRRAVVGVVDVCTARAGDLDRALARMLTDPDAGVRYGVVRAAAGRRPAVLPVLLDLCFDADARCARSAAIAASLWRRTGRVVDAGVDAATRALRRSPHAAVRRLAAEVPVDAGDWFGGGVRGRVAAREALGRQQGRVLAEIRGRLAGDEEAQREAAARLALELEVVEEVEIELLAMLREAGQRGRAAATGAAALGRSGTASAEVALRALLGAPDDRVRANALDALVRRWRGGRGEGDDNGGLADVLAEFKVDGHHRVRAGALRGMLVGVADGSGARSASEGGAGLCAMLGDPRPMHRVAGLWLAERAVEVAAGEMGTWGEVVCRVERMSEVDEEGVVRARAGRCAAGLRARLRWAWAERACGGEEAEGRVEEVRA